MLTPHVATASVDIYSRCRYISPRVRRLLWEVTPVALAVTEGDRDRLLRTARLAIVVRSVSFRLGTA